MAMNILDALSQAAELTRPSARDQLPVASVVLVVLAVLVSGAPAHVPSIARLAYSVKNLQLVGFLTVVFALVAASLVLQPLLAYLDGLLKGEVAPTWLRPLAQAKRAQHRRKLLEYQQHEIKNEMAQVADLLRRYPSPDRVTPSLLGNLLTAAEDTAGGRYQLTTAVVLPRLEAVLPEGAASLLSGRRDDLQFAVRMSSALVIGAALSTVLLLPSILSGEAWPWLALPLSLLVVATASYRNSLRAAIAYGEALAVVFDLHRFTLYTALHLPLPVDLAEERELARRVSIDLWTGYRAQNRSYHHKEGRPDEDSEGEAP